MGVVLVTVVDNSLVDMGKEPDAFNVMNGGLANTRYPVVNSGWNYKLKTNLERYYSSLLELPLTFKLYFFFKSE